VQQPSSISIMASKQVLLVYGSGNGENSISRRVADALLKKLGVEPNVTKDLAVNPPTLVDENWVQARFNPNATDANKNALSTTNSDAAVEEFLAADTIVLAAAMYNFHVSGSVKAWFDQIAVVGKTFKYGEGGNPEALSSGKKLYVVVATGGVQLETPYDFLTPYIKHFMGFLGITDITFIDAAKGNVEGAQAQIDALAGDVPSDWPAFLLTGGQFEPTYKALYHSEAVVRVFNQTDTSMAVFQGDEIMTLLKWLQPGSDPTCQINNKTEFPSTEKAPATSFVAWENASAGLSNCTSVCVYVEGKIYRQNLAIEHKDGAGIENWLKADALESRKPELGKAEPSVNKCFTHHFSTFGAGVAKGENGMIPCAEATMLEQIKDHSNDVIISVWNHHSGIHEIFNGKTEIREYFKNLYPTFGDVSDMNAFVWDVDECATGKPGLAFLVWRSPKSGYPSAADSFVFDSNFMIQRQFMAEVHV